MSEAGSRTLSRFGVEDEQLYLVIRDQFPLGSRPNENLARKALNQGLF